MTHCDFTLCDGDDDDFALKDGVFDVEDCGGDSDDILLTFIGDDDDIIVDDVCDHNNLIKDDGYVIEMMGITTNKQVEIATS